MASSSVVASLSSAFVLALVVGVAAVAAQQQDVAVKGEPPSSTLKPVLIVATKKDLGTDPDVNLPPSHDDKKTVAGTVQGVVKLDGSYEEGLGPVISTNRSSAYLNCTSGSMNVDIEFKEPFYGRVYADFNRHSACAVNGNGGTRYRIDLPLRGCGTIQDPARVFINNIIVRFHAGLELDGDEVKTIICRYPPPVAPPPAVPNIPIIATEPPAPPPVPQALGELEILLIICAILFLALVLLGMGFSYYCLKRRHIRVIKKPVSSPGSEVKSDTTWGALSMFDGLRIPRAHATSMSGSEVNLVTDHEHSDTLPSDYPSESPSSLHSEVEDVDVVQRPASSVSSQQSLRLSSVYSDAHFAVDHETVTAATALKPARPEFDVAVRIKKAPKPPPSPSPSSVTSVASDQMRMEQIERSLSKILEETDDGEDTEPPIIEIPRVTAPSKPPPAPPMVTKTKSLSSINTEQTEARSVSEYLEQPSKMELVPMKASADVVLPVPEKTTHVVDDRYLNTIVETDVYEDVTRHTREITEYMRRPKPSPPDWDIVIRNYPAPRTGPPTATRTLSDDAVSSTTVQSSEWDDQHQQTSSHGRASRTASVVSEAPIRPTTTVVVGPSPDTYDDSRDVDGAAPPPSRRVTTRVDVHTSEHHLTELEVPVGHRPPPNWDVLIRVLTPPPEEVHEVAEVLTDDDKETWRRIITTESTLRSLLSEATVKEDFEKIRRDQRYVKLFEPKKWDVIIRVLASEPQPSDRRSEMSDTTYSSQPGSVTSSARGGGRPPSSDGSEDGGGGGRRPPGGSNGRGPPGASSRGSRRSPPTTSTTNGFGPGNNGEFTDRDRHLLMLNNGRGSRSRRTSKSSGVLENDMRSMTEEMVTDFARSEPDSFSEASGHTSRYPRSMAERSTSEYTDRAHMLEYLDVDGRSLVSSRRASRAGSHPSLERGMSEFAEDWTAVMRESDLESAYSRRTSAASNVLVPSGLIIEEPDEEDEEEQDGGGGGGAMGTVIRRTEHRRHQGASSGMTNVTAEVHRHQYQQSSRNVVARRLDMPEGPLESLEQDIVHQQQQQQQVAGGASRREVRASSAAYSSSSVSNWMSERRN